MIIKYPLNGQYHYRGDVILTSQMTRSIFFSYRRKTLIPNFAHSGMPLYHSKRLKYLNIYLDIWSQPHRSKFEVRVTELCLYVFFQFGIMIISKNCYDKKYFKGVIITSNDIIAGKCRILKLTRLLWGYICFIIIFYVNNLGITIRTK